MDNSNIRNDSANRQLNRRTLITTTLFAAPVMAIGNNNAWFGQALADQNTEKAHRSNFQNYASTEIFTVAI